MTPLEEIEQKALDEQTKEFERIEEEEFQKQKVTVNIVDAICGAGKTSAAINMINKSSDEERFLYITPYLDEVDRVIKSCPKKKFKQPEVYGSKLEGIKYLFSQGRNIVSTHALFRMFDKDVINLVKAMNYTLVMDEVADVVEPLDISKDDLKIVLEKTEVQDNGLLKWVDKNYKGKFGDYKRLCELNAVFYYSDTALVYLFPVDCFKAFSNTYILTYMFDAQMQRYYYDFYGVEFKYIGVEGNSVDTYHFVDHKTELKTDYGKLIKIEFGTPLNSVGNNPYALSVNWYKKNIDTYKNILKNNIYNFFMHYSKTPSNKNLWTTYKDYVPLLKGNGYAKSFLSCNARATNAYMDRTAVAYMCNIFFNPILKDFFLSKGVRVDESNYALSELIQFVFRSAIRNGEEVYFYIPSSRMRNLFYNWTQKH